MADMQYYTVIMGEPIGFPDRVAALLWHWTILFGIDAISKYAYIPS